MRLTPEQISLLSNQMWRLCSGVIYKVVNKQGSVVPFIPNRVQRELFAELHTKNVVLKGRQEGVTTAIDIYLLDVALFEKNKTIGIIANTKETAEDIFNNKIKFAFNNLPDDMREAYSISTENKGEMVISNTGSSISVGTSFRSGTLQYLHITEYGKICAKEPDKAREIQTGALNTLAPECKVFIESTAEGNSGQFYDICQRAIATTAAEKKTGITQDMMSYRFHFFPWFLEAAYSNSNANIEIEDATRRYFEALSANQYILGRFGSSPFTEGQMRWYQEKKKEQGDNMLREYPSTPEEAFQNAVKGAYYDAALAAVIKQGRVCQVEWEPDMPVYTAWDIGGAGGGDDCAIYFFQIFGETVRFIDYWEGNGMGMVEIAEEIVLKKPYSYETHFLPHDANAHEQSTAKRKVQFLRDLGMKCEVLEKTSISDGINLARDVMRRSIFDEKALSTAIRHLNNYKRKWNASAGILGDTPDHDEHSHSADGFRYAAHAAHLIVPQLLSWDSNKKWSNERTYAQEVFEEMDRTRMERAEGGDSDENFVYKLGVR